MGFKYFAFGSNLLKPRLVAGGSTSARVASIAKLEDYVLEFRGFVETWQGASATISPNPGGHVWGVVYNIDDCHREALDRQESVHNKKYLPLTVKVRTTEGEQMEVLTYQLNLAENLQLSPPSPYYKHTIVRGAQVSGLPNDYIAKLEAIPSNGYNGPCKLYERVTEICKQDGVELLLKASQL